ncbi:hypothetical protein V6N11_034860 [Hibiscus sabdariffa]|uniref:Uncharacterized protein n=1 Tax=Hibiscus sabdariffa TaxID=183260 RepID=A0ABR2AHW0_9ROSI
MKMELEQDESETTNMIPVCNCGLRAEMRTSWTKANPDDRPRVVILGLLKSKGAVEKARKKERAIWVIFLAFLAYLAFFRV